MAKWKTSEQAEEGAIRAVNYIVGISADGQPQFNYRLEQLGPWGWQRIPVYQEQPDGSLTEIPQ